MEKMIGVINDNLKSVISGIKTHREDTEKSLAQINNDISEKITIAGNYKDSVDESKKVISNLETEIHDLEKDLEELTAKFTSKNLNSLVEAGTKEINDAIDQKKQEISNQSNNIIEITKKVKALKEELIKLSERKDTTTKNLSDSIILENYYTSKLNEIILFSNEHPEELENYQGLPVKEELNSMEVDETELKKQVDSSVFTEIDNISTDKIDDDMIDSALNYEEEEETEEVPEVKEEIKESTMEDQLDDIISSANALINKTKEIKEKATKTAEPELVTVDTSALEPLVDPEVKQMEDDIDQDFQSILNDYNPNSSLELMDQINDDDLDDGIIDIDIDENKIPESPVNNKFYDDDDDIDESESIDLNELQAALNKIDAKAINNLEDQIEECGLDENLFTSFDVSKLKAHFDLDNTKAFLNTVNKHNISKNVIYKSVDVLNEVTPQNLDIILTLIDKLDVSKETVESVFNHLNKVNINRLEASIRRDRNRELSEILIEAMDYDGDIDLKSLFNLEVGDVKKLQKSSLGNDFKIINTFPELVKENYDLLASFKINNLNECFIKYPHRFVLNPDHFKAILDKYDPEDLVRCINKNAAVINRL